MDTEFSQIKEVIDSNNLKEIFAELNLQGKISDKALLKSQFQKL